MTTEHTKKKKPDYPSPTISGQVYPLNQWLPSRSLWNDTYRLYSLSHKDLVYEDLYRIAHGIHSQVFCCRITRNDSKNNNNCETIICAAKQYQKPSKSREIFTIEVVNQVKCASPTILPIISYIYDEANEDAPLIILLPLGKPLDKYMEDIPSPNFGIVIDNFFLYLSFLFLIFFSFSWYLALKLRFVTEITYAVFIVHREGLSHNDLNAIM